MLQFEKWHGQDVIRCWSVYNKNPKVGDRFFVNATNYVLDEENPYTISPDGNRLCISSGLYDSMTDAAYFKAVMV